MALFALGVGGLERGGWGRWPGTIVDGGFYTSLSSAAPPSGLLGTAVAQHLVSVYPDSQRTLHSTFLVAGCVWNLLPHLARETLYLLPHVHPLPCPFIPPLPLLSTLHQLAGGPASEALSMSTY